jgi:hypothetical protein
VRLMSQVIHQTVSTTSIILTFGFPVAIFTSVGFARLTNPTEALSAFSLCSIMTCFSWTVGRAIKTVIPD